MTPRPDNGRFWLVLTTLALAACLALVSCGATAAEAVIDGPREAPVGPLIRLDASGSTGSLVKWSVDTSDVQVPGRVTPDAALVDAARAVIAAGGDATLPKADPVTLWFVSADGRTLILSSCPGLYRITLAVADETDVDIAHHVVRVGKVDPRPDPTPPDPEPDPQPNPDYPFDGGVAVLVIEENMDRDKIPAGQYDAYASVQTRAWINANAAQDGAGRAFRVWDDDQELPPTIAKFWREGFAKAKAEATSLPWVIITNGVAGYSGPVPESPEAMIRKLEEFKR